MNPTDTKLPPQFDNIQRNALIIGIVGLVLTGVGFVLSQEQFFQSYLFGYVVWLQFPLGCMGILMIQHLTGGRWGFTIRRLIESGAMTVVLMALLFIPILFGMRELYMWARPEEVAEFTLLQHKEPWLNIPFFVGRTVFYFAVWIILAYLLNRWSAEQDKTGNPAIMDRFKILSAGGLILFMLTATFAAYDWMMSLEPKWFSSIYGVIFVAGQAVATMALVIIVSNILIKEKPNDKWFSIDIFSDLSNFMFAFVCFWAYVSFSQYLIIWMANLPETVVWYNVRSQGGWQYFGLALIFLNFALPFLLLLSRTIKRNLRTLIPIAVFILLTRPIDLFWQIMPAFHKSGFHIHWLDFATVIGIGGIWVAFFIWNLKRKSSLLPLNDPRYQEAPAHG